MKKFAFDFNKIYRVKVIAGKYKGKIGTAKDSVTLPGIMMKIHFDGEPAIEWTTLEKDCLEEIE